MRALEASPLLDELDMRSSVRVVCCAVLSCVLSCARDARAEDQPPSRRTSTSTTTIVGASSLATGYVPMFVMATGSLGHAIANFKLLCGGGGLVGFGRCPEHDAVALYIPVVGPLLYARESTGDDLYRRDRGPSSTEQALLYSSAALQLGGLITLLAGVASDARRPETVVAPMTTNGASGVTVARAF